jgi:hypothetical protein
MSPYVLVPLGFIVFLLVIAWLSRDRPLTDEDEYCAAIDQELERRERQQRVDERRARSELYGGTGGWRSR